MPPKKKVTDVQVVPDMSSTSIASVEELEGIIKYMSEKCKGPQFISMIPTKETQTDGRKAMVEKPYPKLEWWTTVGARLGLFLKLEGDTIRLTSREDNEIAYKATVVISKNGETIGRASAICSNKERYKVDNPEHAIESAAITRAGSKAFRLSFSWMAVLAGLEVTPAEEMTEFVEKRERTVMDAGSALKKMSEEKRNGGTSQEYDKEITAAGSLEELADIQKRIMDAKLIKESRRFLIEMLRDKRKELKNA